MVCYFLFFLDIATKIPIKPALPIPINGITDLAVVSSLGVASELFVMVETLVPLVSDVKIAGVVDSVVVVVVISSVEEVVSGSGSVTTGGGISSPFSDIS